jgi:hypothetical protein
MTPPATGRAPTGAPRQRTGVLGLIAIVLLTLIAFSAFFIGFLLAPLAVLLFFSLIFYSRNRAAARSGGQTVQAEPTGGARGRLIIEARERQAALALEERRQRTFTDVPPDEVPHAEKSDDLVPEGVTGDTD